jgi:glycosyltransferase involved in cell wall biosynthesis
MRILQINNCHYRRGGADVVYLNTGEILEKYGHQVSYLSIDDENNIMSDYNKYFIKKKVQIKDNLIIKFFNFKNYFYNKQAAKNIEKLILTEKPEIAHIHLYLGGLTSSILPKLKKHRVPIVYTAHDYRMVCPSYTFLSGNSKICEDCKGRKFYNCTLNRCSKNNLIQSFIMTLEMYYRNLFFNPANYIRGFIFVSQFAKDKHYKYFEKIRDIDNIVLYNSSKIKKNICETVNEKYFLFYGRLSYEKGLKTLVTAFSKLSNIKLKIVGTGPLLEFISDYIESNNIKNIDSIGFLSGDELVNMVKNAYFVIVPSEWYENNPMTIVESYSYGTPVIGANIGGIPEIIQNDKTGYTFKSRDIDDLILKIKLANSLSKENYLTFCNNAYKFSENNFDEDSYYIKLMNFYNEIIKSNKN